MKAQFKFLSGARAGQIEAFRKGYIGLGRHPLSDVRFDAERDLDVSSRHAAIVRKTEGFVLQDLGSRNGTFVNGQRVTADTLLRDRDVAFLLDHRTLTTIDLQRDQHRFVIPASTPGELGRPTWSAAPSPASAPMIMAPR